MVNVSSTSASIIYGPQLQLGTSHLLPGGGVEGGRGVGNLFGDVHRGSNINSLGSWGRGGEVSYILSNIWG